MSGRLGLIGAALILAMPFPGIAQENDSARAAAYNKLAQLPPFEGVWQADWQMVTKLRAAEGDAPLTEDARRKVEEFQASRERGENLQTPGANCLPTGMPNSMRYPYPVEFVYSPDKVNVIIETHSQVRQIWTDGRNLPSDPDLLFNGTSVGEWEGDELIVRTVGLTDQISLIAGLHPTPRTRIEERMWLVEPDRMVIETTITDPVLFTRPFVTELAYNLEPEWEIREFVCQENNRDAADEDGRPSMDLGLDEFG